MARSLKLNPQIINFVKSALLHKGFFRQRDLAESLQLSLSTVHKFLNGKPVDYFNFYEICQALDLDLEEIADFGKYSGLNYILHLSDLHFGTTDNARSWYAQLAEDLRYELNCSRLDALILSGDIASQSTPDQYAAAQLFISRLCQEFQLEPQQIVIVPGNHDLNWELAESAYIRTNREDYQGELREGCYLEESGSVIKVRNEAIYKQKFAHFSRFSQEITGENYPLEYDQQYSLQHLPKQNLLILGLNSAWQIDHYYPSRASINPEVISNVLSQIRRISAYENCLKIAVWHHPVNHGSEDCIKECGFMERLAAAGFRLCLHGGIHRAESSSYHYHYRTGGQIINIIGAGKFGVLTQERSSGYPWQYNLLKIEDSQLTVETRRRDDPNGTWQPDARWFKGSEVEPMPRYIINLDKDYYQQFLGISEEIGDRVGIGNALNCLGNVYSSLEEFQQAIEYYQQSLAIFEEIDDRSGISDSLYNLSRAYDSLGESQRAKDYEQLYLAISDGISDRAGETLARLQNDSDERVRRLARQLLINNRHQSQLISRDEALARIQLIKENLLELDVDALVNPTGLMVSYGGRISWQLVERIGSRLSETLWNQPTLTLGEVFVTDAGSLPASYLIHTPIEEKPDRHTIASVVRGVTAALSKADSMGDVRTIAFPSVGSGAAHLNPLDLAGQVLTAIINHLKQGSSLEKVIFAFVDEPAYQAYVSAYQTLVQESNLVYGISLTIFPEVTSVGGDIEVAISLKSVLEVDDRDYMFQIPKSEAIGSELNILLNAPGFQFNGDNTASLPLDPDVNGETLTRQLTQTATFRLTALRSDTTTITAELYRGDTFETTLETQVQVAEFDTTRFTPKRITTQPRPVPQPDFILRIQTAGNETNSACQFQYQLRSFRIPSLFPGEITYHSEFLSSRWLEQMRGLLGTTLETISDALPEDGRSRLMSLGQYLFTHLLPRELQNDLHTVTRLNRTFTLLILADQDSALPWELLHDGERFLSDRFIIGRWFWELNPTRPHEFPVGAIHVAHYNTVEQPELWTDLLEPPGAPPALPLPDGVLSHLDSTTAMRGLHLIRYSLSDATNRQNAPVRLDNGNQAQDIDRQIRPAKLNLRRHRPLVSLGSVRQDQPELIPLEQTWASAFIRAGCSAFTGSLWAVNPAVEAAFISSFYHRLWMGDSLGEAFQASRHLARAAVPDSLDWLSYVLFGDPMARPYRPVEGKGYAVVEPIGRDIDEPLPPNVPVRFRLSLRRTPPVWHEERVIEVAETLTFDNLQAHVKTFGLQVTPDSPITMNLAPTGNYLGWFTLVAPPEMVENSALVQVFLMDGILPIHSLMFSLTIAAEGGD